MRRIWIFSAHCGFPRRKIFYFPPGTVELGTNCTVRFISERKPDFLKREDLTREKRIAGNSDDGKFATHRWPQEQYMYRIGAVNALTSFLDRFLFGVLGAYA